MRRPLLTCALVNLWLVTSGVDRVDAAWGTEPVDASQEKRVNTPRLPASPTAGPLDKLESKAASVLGDDFAGVAMDAGRPVVFARRSGNRVPVIDNAPVRDVTFSKRQLDDYQAILDEKATQIAERGVPLVGWWVDVPKNVLLVQVKAPADVGEVEAELRRELGNAPIELSVVEGGVILDAMKERSVVPA